MVSQPAPGGTTAREHPGSGVGPIRAVDASRPSPGNLAKPRDQKRGMPASAE
jgi:hypothetical protein